MKTISNPICCEHDYYENYCACCSNQCEKCRESWSCADCGATTTDPEHMLITYFHMNCPARKKKED